MNVYGPNLSRTRSGISEVRDLAPHRLEAVDHALDAKGFFDPLSGPSPQLLALWTSQSYQRGQGATQSIGILWRNDASCIANQGRGVTHIGDGARDTARHHFTDDVWEALPHR